LAGWLTQTIRTAHVRPSSALQSISPKSVSSKKTHPDYCQKKFLIWDRPDTSRSTLRATSKDGINGSSTFGAAGSGISARGACRIPIGLPRIPIGGFAGACLIPSGVPRMPIGGSAWICTGISSWPGRLIGPGGFRGACLIPSGVPRMPIEGPDWICTGISSWPGRLIRPGGFAGACLIPCGVPRMPSEGPDWICPGILADWCAFFCR